MLLLFWIMDGVAAGWMSCKLLWSEARGRVMDIATGIAGALAGGILFSATHLLVRGMMIYTNLAAVMAAVIVTLLSRYGGDRREYGATGQMEASRIT